jgi:hypothetical protein
MIRTNNFASQCEANQTEQMPLGSISVFYAMTYFSQYRLRAHLTNDYDCKIADEIGSSSQRRKRASNDALLSHVASNVIRD